MHKRKSNVGDKPCEVIISEYPFVRSVAVKLEDESSPIVSKLDFTPKMDLDDHINMVLEEAERRR